MPLVEGKWKLTVEAVDDQGETSTTTQAFSVNDTLATLRLTPARLVVRAGGHKRLRAGVSLSRAATVTVSVETRAGVAVARVLRRRVPAGRFDASWDGRTAGGRTFAFGGGYTLKVTATNPVGARRTSRPFRCCAPRR